MKSNLVRIGVIAAMSLAGQSVLLSQRANGRIQITGSIAPSYQLTVTVGDQKYVAEGTSLSLRVPAGPAIVRVRKANSSSETFRLEADGRALVEDGAYDKEIEVTVPGDPGDRVQLNWKANF